MKTIIEEYGRIILYASVGAVIIGVIIVGIRLWYQNSYPGLEQDSSIGFYSTAESPILLVDKIEIDFDMISGEIDYESYAIGYMKSDDQIDVVIEVIGTEFVDLEAKGLYQVIFQVISSNGETFTKYVPVLIY